MQIAIKIVWGIKVTARKCYRQRSLSTGKCAKWHNDCRDWLIIDVVIRKFVGEAHTLQGNCHSITTVQYTETRCQCSDALLRKRGLSASVLNQVVRLFTESHFVCQHVLLQREDMLGIV